MPEKSYYSLYCPNNGNCADEAAAICLLGKAGKEVSFVTGISSVLNSIEMENWNCDSYLFI